MYYSSSTQINSALCQEQSLRVYSIALSDNSSLFQPLPLFYMEPQCSGGVGFNATSASDNLQIPSFLDHSSVIKINEYFQFPDTIRIHSIYVPPGVKVTSYMYNPDTYTDSFNHRIEFPPNTLIIDTCYQHLTLEDGSPFFSFKSGSMTVDYWYSKWLLQATTSTTDLNKSIVSLCQNDNITHRTKWWKIEILTDFKTLLRDTCLSGKPLFIGDHDMREFWYPQSPSCDQLMLEYCKSNPLVTSCKCYRQQSLLDQKFNKDLKVPVCCFGHMVDDQPNAMANSCIMNPNAYKSKEMLSNCCQHTLCFQDVDAKSTMNCSDVPHAMLSMLANVQTKTKDLNDKAKQVHAIAKQEFIARNGINQPISNTDSKTMSVSENYTEKPRIVWIITLIGIIFCVVAFFITLVYSAYYTSSFGTNQLILKDESAD